MNIVLNNKIDQVHDGMTIEQLLYKRIISQVIEFDRFRRNQQKFIYDLTNISLGRKLLKSIVVSID